MMRPSSSPRRLVVGLAAVAMGVVLAAGPARGADERMTLEQALADLKRLNEDLKLSPKKRANEDVIASLDAVAKAYIAGVQEPEPPPADASEDVKEAFEAQKRKHAAAVEAFRKEARKLFEDALTKQAITGQKDDKSNSREDVNIKAFQILGQTKDAKFAGDIMRAIEVHLAKAKYRVSTGLWEAAFASLAQLDQEESTKDAIPWILKNYTHANSSPEEAVEQLIAAHKSIPLYRNIRGRDRYDLVDAMIKSYTGKESQAEQSKNDPKNQAAKVFWDRIKTDVIKALSHLTKGKATDDQGQPATTMKHYADWFRSNDNWKKDPWLDDEKKADEKKADEKKADEKKDEPKTEEGKDEPKPEAGNGK
jgi:hypothetical protein